MPRRPARPVGPKVYASKQFSAEEIRFGIEKLRRRIAEVKALKEKGVASGDQATRTAEFNIQETIREIFGDDSAEYDKHRYYDIWKGSIQIMASEREIQERFEAGIPEAVAMLEGLIQRLEEKLADLSYDSTASVKATISGFDVHVRISSVATDLFENGHYAEAVLKATIALKNYVQEKSGQDNLDGAPLMRTVFSRNNPVLAFNSLSDQTEEDEQEGMMHLFEGTMLGIRNPRAHDLLEDDPQRALEYIVLLSLLAKRVDEAKKVRRA